jgi:hypothetical protein
MKFVSLLLTFFMVAPCVKVVSDELYDNQEGSLRGAPTAVGNEEESRDEPIVIADGISEKEYNRIFLNDIGRYLPFLQGDPVENEEESSNANLNRKLQSMTLRVVLMCRVPDCSDEHKYAGPGFYDVMPWEVESEELFYVYIPARTSFQYFEKPNFSGWTRTFTGGNKGVHVNLNSHSQAISSFIIKHY